MTNLEMLCHDVEPHAISSTAGTYVRAEPLLVLSADLGTKLTVGKGIETAIRSSNQ